MSDPKDYTVGWICAISTEYVAAQAFLDEKHDGPEYLAPHNKNDYTLGRIGKHNVAIAVLPMGEYGTASASRVAEDLMHSFPNIRIGLVVGIGGGAPSEKNDIRLGDIVVGMPSNNGRGGVLQYDFGKMIQSQGFQQTRFLNQPPTILRAAVNGLNAHYEMEGHRLKDMIDAALEKKPRLKSRYGRPTCDRLYQSHVIHSPESRVSCAQGCGDDEASLVTRRPRSEYEDDPAIHYGLIASANRLMKDALIRDRLAAEENVLCFEMEAAGLMNHFPCLIIRGICDYSDTHKNNDWQGYAAMVAAAYAKDLLCRIVPQQVEAERKIQETLDHIYNDLGTLSTKVDEIVNTQYDSEQEKILTWLTPLDFSPLQNDLISRKQEGTGEWLVETSEYQQWESTRACILFCPGIPGAGKTMTASFVIDHLRRKHGNDRDGRVIFIYCNYKTEQEMRPVDLFSCLLKQLSRNVSTLPESVMTLYTKHKLDQSRPSLKEVLIALRSAIQSFPKTFIIVDALDEYETSRRIQVMEELFDIVEKTKANLLATSRFVATVEAMFAERDALSREIQALPADLERFVDGNVHQLPSFVLNNSALRAAIKHEIVQAANGMFLLAQLHMGSLCGLRSPKAIKLALKNLRTGVDAYDHAYHEAMQRIKAQVPGSRELATEVLSWIILAQEPLSLAELLHALAIEIGESTLDEDNISDVDHLVSVCVGLVTVDKESGVVRLVHYTAQEYFQKSKDVWFPHGHDLLTRKCMTYLTFDTFSGESYHKKDVLDKKFTLYPFLDYSARNWWRHGLSSSIDGDELTLRFFENYSRVSACYRAMTRRPDYLSPFISFPENWTTGHQGVYLAVLFGLSKTMEKLLNKDVDWELQDRHGLTLLSIAAEAGHEDVVKIILDRKGSVDIPDRHMATPLHHAARAGHTAVIKLLLDRGASVDYEGLSKMSPLEIASEYGHVDAVRLLLDRHADINHQSEGFHCTPVSVASYRGHTVVVQLLLERGAFINHTDRRKCTPLSWACIKGSEAVARILLGKNADPSIKDSDGWTPLFQAAANDSPGCVNLLLEHGSDINTQESSNFTPLMWAAMKNMSDMVELILDRDACVNMKNIQGHTALSLAVMNCHLRPVRLLLERGADVNIQDHQGCTALLMATWKDHLQVVRLLLERGAEINTKDHKGRTALLMAAWKDHLQVVRLLLERGADVNLQDHKDHTALLLASKKGHLQVVSLLFKKGADVNVQDYKGRTPLLLAAARGHLEVVVILLEYGAEMSILDKNDRTALSQAVAEGHKDVEIFLRQHHTESQLATRMNQP